jgi:hypothetical protein
MSGAAGRNKGRRGELEAAKILKGKRISKVGETGPDVEDWQGNKWEIKRSKSNYKLLYRNMKQSPDVERLAVRQDREQWLAIIPLTMYIDLATTAEKYDTLHTQEHQ